MVSDPGLLMKMAKKDFGQKRIEDAEGVICLKFGKILFQSGILGCNRFFVLCSLIQMFSIGFFDGFLPLKEIHEETSFWSRVNFYLEEHDKNYSPPVLVTLKVSMESNMIFGSKRMKDLLSMMNGDSVTFSEAMENQFSIGEILHYCRHTGECYVLGLVKEVGLNFGSYIL